MIKIWNIVSLVFLFCSIIALPAGEAEDDDTYSRNPEEAGDIIIGRVKRSGIKRRYSHRYWPDATIPYVIEGPYDLQDRALLEKAIQTIQLWTCFRFVPFTDQKDYITIRNDPDKVCWSFQGRSGGNQIVRLNSPKCFNKIGILLHVLLSAIGVVHEHNRPDRDDYITVNMENVIEDRKADFEKFPLGMTDNFSIPYDYNSVMHYSEYAASKNGQKTIVPKMKYFNDVTAINHRTARAAHVIDLPTFPTPDGSTSNKFEGVQIGQRDGLSVRDALTIMTMYNCTITGLKVSNTEKFSRVMPNYGESSLSKEALWNTFYRN